MNSTSHEGSIPPRDPSPQTQEIGCENRDLVKSSFNDVSDFEIKSNLGLVISLNTSNDDCTQIVNEIKKK